MKLSKNEQEFVEHVRENATRYGNTGAGDLNPRTRHGKRTRKLIDAGILILVGCGKPSPGYPGSFVGGIGLIPTDMFDRDKHTKIPASDKN